MVPTTGIEL
ncbi:hypothetical protein D029_4771A, partial [Vibrio parahaemolyticus 970107]